MNLPLLFTLLLLLLTAPSRCRPSRPLNERGPQLAWEAWLLVDQPSSLNSGPGAALPRRKITPKSVFITPTFSPELLPACADGYQSDAMGRCVKIIKLNESFHYDFLLQKLNAQFSDYEEEEEAAGGPLQVNIPLEEAEMAIVVTPKRPHERTTLQVDVRGKGGSFSVESVAEMLGVSPEEVEMTTIAEMASTTTEMVPTTTEEVTESTTLDTTTLESTTAMESTTLDSTTTEGEALFFMS